MSSLRFPSLLVAAFTLLAQSGSRSGVDPSTLDPSCKACDDFWRYANGGWLDKNPIPSHRSSWGTLSVMTDANRERLRVILEAAAASKAPAGSNERRIGDFYAGCLDTAAIDARGASPLRAPFEKIAAISARQQLGPALVALFRTSRAGPLRITASPDYKDSERVIAHISPAGLSLPDRDYYFKEDARSRQIREEFLAHAARMLVLLGDKPDPAAAAARAILSLETSLAGATMDRAARRDPYARYHVTSAAGLAALVPAVDWKSLWKTLDVSEPASVNVTEPAFLQRLQERLEQTPLEDWKTWLRWRLLSEAATLLARPIEEESFAFNQTVLTGVRQKAARWETCAIAVDRNLGEALGELFVAKHFPPQAARRMRQLVENLRETLREELSSSSWLSAETRRNAVAKLNAFVPKIGHPEKWRDYSALSFDRKRHFENVQAALSHDRGLDLATIGKPVDRSEWRMTPPTVNAYYSPLQNEIVFPAGILQPPLFDIEADDAANYGAIGAVIGHEMGHGFDDQGSKFDAKGNLVNWWTPEDRSAFEKRAACVIDQFNTLDVGGGLRHNGKLVVGEALGDLGGLTLAYRAWRRSLRGQPEPPAVHGFTASQRFFLAFARVWASQYRDEMARHRLTTDPHPIAKFRTNGTLQNMPEFHQAFGCKQGDPMVRPPATQCKLW